MDYEISLLPGLEQEYFGLYYKKEQTVEPLVFLDLLSKIKEETENYLVSIGIPEIKVKNWDNFDIFCNQKTRFPEYASVIENPIPYHWEFLISYANKQKEKYMIGKEHVSLKNIPIINDIGDEPELFAITDECCMGTKSFLELDVDAVLYVLSGLDYKIGPSFSITDGSLLNNNNYSLFIGNSQEAESAAYFAGDRAYQKQVGKILVNLGIPKNEVYNWGKYCPKQDAKKRFPEYAHIIPNVLPIDWKGITEEINKTKEKEKRKNSKSDLYDNQNELDIENSFF